MLPKFFFIALSVFLSVTPLMAYDEIPFQAKAPKMDGKFDPAEWKNALKLDKFLTIHSRNAAPTKTEVYLLHNNKVLYIAAILHGEDVPNLIKSAKKDLPQPPWRLSGIEMFFGGKVYLQMAFDYMGRLYCNYDHPLYSKINHYANRYVIRTAVPFAKLPRTELSENMIRMNFYRKAKSGVSSAYYNARSTFLDMDATGLLLLGKAEDAVKKMAHTYEKEVAALGQNKVISQKDMEKLSAMIADKKAAALQACGKGDKVFLESCMAIQALRKDIASARKNSMEKKFGKLETPAFLSTPFDTIPARWLPKKLNGRDFWYGFITVGWESLQKAGLFKEPLLNEAMFFFRWNSPDEFLPGGKYHKWLSQYPNNAFAVKSIDTYELSERSRKQREAKALFDKPFIEKFLKTYGERFLWFWEDEALCSDAGTFVKRIKTFKQPIPKNRQEALKTFQYLYKLTSKEVPKDIAFRNVANMSEATAKYVSTGAATQLNHLVLALGDKMSGNENGDCMGAFAPKVAFARGAARQYGTAWKNYNTYYNGTRLNSEKGQGRCVGKTTSPNYTHVEYQLSPKCLFMTPYGFLDGLGAGTPLEAQKQSYLYPYMCGVGVWVSEADIEEMTSVYTLDEKVEDLVLNLRDQKLHLSPIARQQAHFYDNIVKKRDRGVTVTPVALVYDRAHGYLPLYFGNRVWDLFNPTDLEKSMWAVDWHLYKREENVTSSAWTVNPFGDMFDVITNDIQLEVLQDYPVLYLVGDVTLDKKFASQLQAYVKKGGTLIVNTALLAKYPRAFRKDFLGCTLSGRSGMSPGTYSRIGASVITEKQNYKYHIVTPAGKCQVLAVTMDSAQNPAILSNPYGKGKVIVTTPENMKKAESMDEMLALFDHLMGTIRKEAIPLQVETTMQYSVNKNKSSWLVYLHNTKGLPARKGVFRGKNYPKIDKNKIGKARIIVPEKAGKVKKVIDWWSGKELPFRTSKLFGKGDCTLEITLPGCDTTVLEFVMK